MTHPSWSMIGTLNAALPVQRGLGNATSTSAHRLHLFSLDLSERSFERAGGLGITVPTLPIEVTASIDHEHPIDTIAPEFSEDLAPVIEKVRSRVGVNCALDVTVCGRILRHKGLGSTTQIRALTALSAWAALTGGSAPTFADLMSIDMLDAGSCVGLTLIAAPGMTIDFGFFTAPQRVDDGWVPHLRQPQLYRKPQGLALHLLDPPPWHVVVALPTDFGLNGSAEVEFYGKNLPVSELIAEEISYWTLLDLLPACVTGDLDRARLALDRISSLPVKADEIAIQGTDTHTTMKVMERLLGFAGLSSVGPAVYSLTDRHMSGEKRAELLSALPPGTEVLEFALRDIPRRGRNEGVLIP